LKGVVVDQSYRMFFKKKQYPARRLALGMVNAAQAVCANALAYASFAEKAAHAPRPARIEQPQWQNVCFRHWLVRRHSMLLGVFESTAFRRMVF
jgi:hypothetical protein